MGYTHYWTQTRDLTPEEMGDIAGSIRRIIAEAEGKPGIHNYNDTASVPLVICGGDGTGKPELSKEFISFNGEGPDRNHETFYIEASRLGWEFCKTAQKPYDVVVVACLTFLCADYGFRVSSDGDHDDLQRGVDLCCKALGRGYPHPLTVETMLPAVRSA